MTNITDKTYRDLYPLEYAVMDMSKYRCKIAKIPQKIPKTYLDILRDALMLHAESIRKG